MKKKQKVSKDQMVLDVVPVRYVRWKPYGFTHVVAEGKEHPRYGGPTSLCGNSFSVWWVRQPGERQYMTAKEIAKYLVPSPKDDGQRPLCGTCAKALKKIQTQQKG